MIQKDAKRMKKRQIWNIIFAVLFVLLFAIEIVAFSSILRLNMLPGTLVALIVAVFLVYDCVTAYFMFLRGRKVSRKMARTVAKRRRIIACVLAIVMGCGCVVITTVANDVYDTLNVAPAAQPEEPEEVGVTRTVYVRTHDKAQTLADAKAYNYGIVIHYDDECTQQAIAEIQKQVGGTIQTTEFVSVFEMADALLSGKLDAMILNSGFISVLEGEERYESFGEQTRSLADVKIEGNGEELDGSGLLLNVEADIAENGKLKPFIVYISGSDSREGVLNNGRSDVNILAAVNPETRQVLLVNSPRDFVVSNPAGNGAKDKLTHCGIWGVQNSMGALEELYGHPVQYYAQLNFTGLEELVDAIGGITVKSDVAFTLYRNAGKIKVGKNTLNGKEALAFARTRKGLDGGDNDRGKNQMKVIKAIINKATDGATIINNYGAIMKSIDGMFIMNIPMPLISQLVKNQLADMSGWNVVSYSSTGKGGFYECYSSPGQKLSAVMPDEASVSKASKLIEKVFAGENMTDVVMNTTT